MWVTRLLNLVLLVPGYHGEITPVDFHVQLFMLAIQSVEIARTSTRRDRDPPCPSSWDSVPLAQVWMKFNLTGAFYDDGITASRMRSACAGVLAGECRQRQSRRQKLLGANNNLPYVKLNIRLPLSLSLIACNFTPYVRPNDHKKMPRTAILTRILLTMMFEFKSAIATDQSSACADALTFSHRAATVTNVLLVDRNLLCMVPSDSTI
eukprot:SAG11_NODE_1453_length_4879_cov_7.322176_1_plen_208_part_00